MKKLLGLAAVLCLLSACQREQGYRINGVVPGTPNGIKVYLCQGENRLDSAVMKEGKFVLKGKVDIPAKYEIWLDLTPEAKEMYEKDLRGSSVFIENSEIRYECASIDSLASRFQGGESGVRVTGSESHDLYEAYCNELAPYTQDAREIQARYQEEYHIPAGEGVFNTRQGIALIRQLKEVGKASEKIRWDFIRQHPQSPVALEVALDLIYSAKMNKAEMNCLLHTVDTTLWRSPVYQEVSKRVEELYPVAIGEKYTDLELTDREGEKVHLSDYIQPGQYNMIEFWASWCGPCRYEIPHLKHVYEVYGKDALNMVCVSLDEKKKDWEKALEEEKMNWVQLSDPTGWEGEVVKKYHIYGIPYSILLDPEGRIIDREVRGSELDVLLTDHIGDRFKE